MNPQDFSSNFTPDRLIQLLSEHQPIWVYLLVALIPLSMLFAFRECCCWFWKINQLQRNSSRIEKLLEELVRQRRSAPVAPPTSTLPPLPNKDIEH